MTVGRECTATITEYVLESMRIPLTFVAVASRVPEIMLSFGVCLPRT